MTTKEKLHLMDEINARNAARTSEYAEKIAKIHRAIETNAKVNVENIGYLAQAFDVDRSELLELLVNTMWALEQAAEQEGEDGR